MRGDKGLPLHIVGVIVYERDLAAGRTEQVNGQLTTRLCRVLDIRSADHAGRDVTKGKDPDVRVVIFRAEGKHL